MNAQDTAAVTAENLKRLREISGYSRRGLLSALEAEGVTVHQTTLSRIEAGSQPLRLAEAVAFARVYGVSLTELTEEDVDLSDLAVDRAEREAKGIAAQMSGLNGRLGGLGTELSDSVPTAGARDFAARISKVEGLVSAALEGLLGPTD